jgi:hypothetical protein
VDGGGVRIEGLDNTIKALRYLEPEIFKELRGAVQKAAKTTAAAASALRPGARYKTSFRASGKFPGGRIIGQMGAQSSRNDWSDPATRSVIFEFAKTGRTPQSAAAIDSFQSRYGSPGRFLWEAWDRQEDTYLSDVNAAVDKAAAAIQRRLETVG